MGFERIYDDLLKTAKKNGKKFLEKLGELMDDHQEWGEAEGEGGDKANKAGKGNLCTPKKNLRRSETKSKKQW